MFAVVATDANGQTTTVLSTQTGTVVVDIVPETTAAGVSGTNSASSPESTNNDNGVTELNTGLKSWMVVIGGAFMGAYLL